MKRKNNKKKNIKIKIHMTHTSHQSQGFCRRTAWAEFSPQSFWVPGCEWSKQWHAAVGSLSQGACPPEPTSVNECTLLLMPVRDRKRSRDSGKEITSVRDMQRWMCLFRWIKNANEQENNQIFPSTAENTKK